MSTSSNRLSLSAAATNLSIDYDVVQRHKGATTALDATTAAAIARALESGLGGRKVTKATIILEEDATGSALSVTPAGSDFDSRILAMEPKMPELDALVLKTFRPEDLTEISLLGETLNTSHESFIHFVMKDPFTSKYAGAFSAMCYAFAKMTGCSVNIVHDYDFSELVRMIGGTARTDGVAIDFMPTGWAGGAARQSAVCHQMSGHIWNFSTDKYAVVKNAMVGAATTLCTNATDDPTARLQAFLDDGWTLVGPNTDSFSSYSGYYTQSVYAADTLLPNGNPAYIPAGNLGQGDWTAQIVAGTVAAGIDKVFVLCAQGVALDAGMSTCVTGTDFRDCFLIADAKVTSYITKPAPEADQTKFNKIKKALEMLRDSGLSQAIHTHAFGVYNDLSGKTFSIDGVDKTISDAIPASDYPEVTQGYDPAFRKLAHESIVPDCVPWHLICGVNEHKCDAWTQ